MSKAHDLVKWLLDEGFVENDLLFVKRDEHAKYIVGIGQKNIAFRVEGKRHYCMTSIPLDDIEDLPLCTLKEMVTANLEGNLKYIIEREA